MDDGGGWRAAQTTAHLWECDPKNQNQWFVLDEDTMMLYNPAKDNLCFDDGGGTTPGSTEYMLWTCDGKNPNQHFEVLSAAAVAAEKKKARIAAGNTAVDILVSGQEIMLRVRGKSDLCVDDGGGHLNGETQFGNQLCDPDSPNQVFTYNPMTHQFESTNKPGMCIDDGGGWSAAETTVHLWECDPNNPNQWFVMDEGNMMLRNPVKPNLCFDDGGAMTPGASKYWLWTCDVSNTNQHFEIVSPALMPPLVQQDAEVDSNGPILENSDAQYMKTIESGVKVLIRAHPKKKLCLDDGGGHSNGETKFVYKPCDPNSPNQIFSYDVSTKEFQSVNKPGLCLDDGGGWNAGDSTAHLWECDSGNENQWFVTDPDTMLLHNPAKPGLCFEDTGATEPGKSNFVMWYCNLGSPNQQFEVVPQWELLGTTTDVGPPPLPVIEDGLWSTVDNGNDVLPPPPISDILPPVVVDDTGAVVEPTSPNVDDGGVVSPNGAALPNDDNVILPQVDSIGFGPSGDQGVMKPLGNQNPDSEYTGTSQGLIIEDGGIVVVPPANDQVTSVQSTATTFDDDIVAVSEALGPVTGFNTAVPSPVDGDRYTPTTIDGGNVASSEPLGPVTGFNPAVPSLVDSDSVQPTDATPRWEPSSNQNPISENTGTSPGPIIEDGGIVVIPPVNDPIVSVQSTATVIAGWEDTLAGSFGPARGVDSDTVSPDISLAPASDTRTLPKNPDQVGPTGPAVLPVQQDANLPIPNVPVIMKADMPLANFGDRDWNLLAPSNDTLSAINPDNSAIISAAKIFK
ncbi:hypothetical protein PF001_g8181, partial [Phytophthora fragariae]